MNKPVIAIDCDDVIVGTAPDIIEHYNATYDTNIKLKDYYTNDLKILGVTDRKTFARRIQTYLNSPEYQKIEPFQDAVEVIHELTSKYELHIVTARPDFLSDVTKLMLQKYFPDVFSSVIFTNHFSDKQRSKADVCNELNAIYLIDDHLHHAEIAAKQGISVLLFGNYPWNKSATLPDSVQRVEDWHEVQNILLK